MAICSICEALGLVILIRVLAGYTRFLSKVNQVLLKSQTAIICAQDRWSRMTQGSACCDVGIEGKCDSGQHSPTLSLDSKNKNIHGNENFADMLSSSNHTDQGNTPSQRSCGCNAL